MSFVRPLSYYESRFHAKQEDAWLAYKAGLTLVLPWGRRSGKSDLFAEILIEDVETTGYGSMFAAKTQRQARKIIWPKFARRLRNEPNWKVNESRLEFIYKRGPTLAVRGTDLASDNLAGDACRIIACDEYALWKRPEVKELILAPMLADYDGQFLFGSTKRGKNHFFKLHQEALSNPNKYFINEATMFDNPFISDKGRSKVIQEYPGGNDNPLYNQEVLNKYVVFSGQVFALPVESYTGRRWDPGELEWCYHFGGMDHGYSPDPTAHVWIAYSPKRGKFQVYSEYKQERLLINQHSEVIRKQEPYRLIDIHSDIDPQVQAEYAAVKLDLVSANKADKKARLLALVNALRIGRVEIATTCTALLEEMSALTWEDVDKKKGDDHLIDAFDYGFNNLTVPTVDAAEEAESTGHSRNPEGGSFSQSFGD